jgi:major histocompatibility complex class I
MAETKFVKGKKSVSIFFSTTKYKKSVLQPGVVAHAFNPSTWEAETGGFLSSRLAWSTE